ncbi:MAG: CD1247 N-terminal domain-containing protein [bacterium]|jgi:endogenous inhibitor of DNA gyrase (YacG/DUF329 family)
MAELKEKIAYLQGLAEGSGMNSNSREGQLLNGIIGALAAVAGEVERVREEQEELSRYTEYVDMDLGELEEEVYGADDTLDLVEMKCPHCGQAVYFEEEALDADEPLEVTCPDCGDLVYSNDREKMVARNGVDGEKT